MAGAFFWIFTGSIENSVSLAVYTEADMSSGFVPVEEAGRIAAGMKARIGGAEGTVQKVSSRTMSYEEMSGAVGEDTLRAMGISAGVRLCMVSFSAEDAPKGISGAEIILEVIRPVSFLLR